MTKSFWILMCSAFLSHADVFAQADAKTLFFISNSHLDTQWNWDVKTTIGEYVKNTMEQNFKLLDKYPNFNFNYEGAIKYSWMKEYYPDDFAKLKQYVADGRWHVSGCSVDANDVMVSSAESIMRNFLYGHVFYEQEFGVRGGYDIMLPDCFGFPYSLPSLAKASGMKGFHTAKLAWGSAQYDALAPWGIWQGVDGSQIYAIYKPHAYDSHEDYNKDMANDAGMASTIQSNYDKYGLAAEMRYVGPRSDHGGGLKDDASSTGENTPYWLNYSVTSNGPVKVVMATPDSIFNYMDKYRNDKYQVYTGELPMRTHGVGAYTSRGMLKLWNRRNELLADAAEKTSVVADWLGLTAYPTALLRTAWMGNLWQAHHDGITGTSIPKAYVYSENEYVIANKTFGNVLSNAVGATVRLLNTNVEGRPVVVYNPLSQDRTDIVEAELSTSTRPAGVRVYNKEGKEVLAQVNDYDAVAGKAKIIFAATVPSLGYAVYDVRLGERCSLTSNLTVDESSRKMANDSCALTINSTGDIESVILKSLNRRLLSPLSLQMLDDNSTTWPAWEITWDSDHGDPIGTVDENVSISLAENGPLRKSFRVFRTKNGSSFVQYIRLNAISPRIDCVSEVDWQSKRTMLKANFPIFRMNVDSITYDISLGTIKRGVSNENLYEMQGHQWADMSNGTCGVSIMNDCKYGWDMPKKGDLRLTLIHTPYTGGSYSPQGYQDIGVNKFTYSVYPHKGNWNEQTQIAASQLNQPLLAFEAPKHDGALGRSFGFVSLNTDEVAVKALKKAELSDDYIVRVYEWTGKNHHNVTMTFPADVLSAKEVTSLEDETVNGGAVTVSGRTVTFDLNKYQPKSFAVRLASPQLEVAEDKPVSSPVALDYDVDVMSYNAKRSDATAGIKYAYPAELISDTLVADGIAFKMGDRADGKNNAVKCAGQTLSFERKAGQNKLYLLLMSTNTGGDVAAVKAGKADYAFEVPYYGGYVGQLGSAFTTTMYRKENIALTAGHCHNVSSGKDEIFDHLYLYKYVVSLSGGVNTVTLPDKGGVYLLAASLSDNADDDVKPLSAINTYIDYDELGPADDGECGTYLSPTAINASGATNANELGKFAADRDVSTKWCVTNQSNPWLEYDYDTPVEVCKWEVLNAASESDDWVTRNFKLQYDDNGVWKDADEVSSNTENHVVRGISPVKSGKFRLFVGQGEQNGTTARIYEFALYGEDSSTSGIDDVVADAGSDFKLLGNSPNPFRTQTTVQCVAPQGLHAVRMQVIDYAGCVVDERTFHLGGSGLTSFVWTNNLPSGLYLYRLGAHKSGRDIYTHTKKLFIK